MEYCRKKEYDGNGGSCPPAVFAEIGDGDLDRFRREEMLPEGKKAFGRKMLPEGKKE